MDNAKAGQHILRCIVIHQLSTASKCSLVLDGASIQWQVQGGFFAPGNEQVYEQNEGISKARRHWRELLSKVYQEQWYLSSSYGSAAAPAAL